MQTIAVYGSSAVQTHEQDYIDAYQVGKALAQAGYTVMTGGYGGVMEATSKGASEGNGHVIGVTTPAIEAFRNDETRPNQWISEEIRYESLRERVEHLVMQADAYVVMPGGLGTLHELSTVWELVRVGDITNRPIICYGMFWHDVLATLRDNAYVKSDSWDVLQFVNTVDELITSLKQDLIHNK